MRSYLLCIKQLIYYGLSIAYLLFMLQGSLSYSFARQDMAGRDVLPNVFTCSSAISACERGVSTISILSSISMRTALLLLLSLLLFVVLVLILVFVLLFLFVLLLSLLLLLSLFVLLLLVSLLLVCVYRRALGPRPGPAGRHAEGQALRIINICTFPDRRIILLLLLIIMIITVIILIMIIIRICYY